MGEKKTKERRENSWRKKEKTTWKLNRKQRKLVEQQGRITNRDQKRSLVDSLFPSLSMNLGSLAVLTLGPNEVSDVTAANEPQSTKQEGCTVVLHFPRFPLARLQVLEWLRTRYIIKCVQLLLQG